jgi:ketosteroid isomerase-like protein
MSTAATATVAAAPTATERDALFKTFGRAFFKKDVELMYQVVTPYFAWASHSTDGTVQRYRTRDAVAAKLTEASSRMEVRFHDVVYHHAPDATFMTFRITYTDKGTGRACEETGVERYTFRDGRIALKDVYIKPSGATA